jgi:hypothetical protein
MHTFTDASIGTDRRQRRRPRLPAYGPVDAVVGVAVFYLFVDRATPTVVDVVTSAVPGISVETVGLGLAALLWVVLGIVLFEQLQRQLAAVGVGTRSAVRRADRQAGTPGAFQFLVYLGGLAVGGAVALSTFETAVLAGLTTIRIVGTLDTGAFVLVDFATMLVFFVSFAVASHSLDRLVIGIVRRVVGQ